MKTYTTIAALTCLFLVGCGENKSPYEPAEKWTGAIAAESGDIAAIEKHLAGGADINAKDPDPYSGSTLLILTSMYGHLEAAEWLIEKGASVDVPNVGGVTALNGAAFFCHPEIVALLLENGADVNHKTLQGATPLDAVTWRWNQSLRDIYAGVGGLLEMEIDIERIERVRPEIAELLRKKGGEQNPDLDIREAVKMGRLEIVEKYLAAGNNVEGKDPGEINDWTLLGLAATFGQPEVVELLLEEGADINGRFLGKNTALQWAAMLSQGEVVELLIEKGADINLESGYDRDVGSTWTALDHVTRHRPENWNLALLAIGVNNQHPVDVDRIRRDRPEIAKLLREAGGEQGDAPKP